MTLTGTGGNATLDTNGYAVTLSGQLSGPGGSNKMGTNTLTLGAANTYSGPTTINAGKSLVPGALGNTAVSVGGGASLGGAGSIAGSVAVAGGNSFSTQGTLDLVDGTIGTLTLSDPTAADTVLTLGGIAPGSPSILNVELGTTADRILLSAGKLAVNPGGAINVTPLGSFGMGTYDLHRFRQRSGHRPG